MNDKGSAAYHLSRAQQEDEAARKAVNPLAASIHRTLASRYEGAGEVEHELKIANASLPLDSSGSILHPLAAAFRKELGR